MINQRLFDHYGIDTTKDLKITPRCVRPWDTVLIDKQGSCYACECTAWLPQSIGNLQVKGLAEIIGSDTHRHLQDSISDGTYRYCNQRQCTYFRDSDWPTHTTNNIQNLRLAIDDSCNLRCPSCRTGLVFHKTGNKFRLGIRLSDRINEWLRSVQHDITIHIGSDGDPFASHVYRHFMEQTPRKDNIRYSILTNGLMFKEFHDKIPHIMNGLTTLGISIDGATAETYEKLRLGGKWDKLIESLESVTDAKRQHGFELHWHMVVQQDNWQEMPAMMDLAYKHEVDRVFFNRIQDWNTGLDFEKQKFHDLDDFKELRDTVTRDPISSTFGLF